MELQITLRVFLPTALVFDEFELSGNDLPLPIGLNRIQSQSRKVMNENFKIASSSFHFLTKSSLLHPKFRSAQLDP
jgi:hypothetical protein